MITRGCSVSESASDVSAIATILRVNEAARTRGALVHALARAE